MESYSAPGGVQDTGNPVLDSTVNILRTFNCGVAKDTFLRELHAVVLELAEKEPGGLKTHRVSKGRRKRVVQ